MSANVFGDKHIVVVDLGFGDAGKGATVDWLCSSGADLDVRAVVRFNGGAQAAHNVVVDGRHHAFSQFGSGTLSGVPTFLSRHMLVEPIALATEARELEALGVHAPLDLIAIDDRALLTTPIHIAANRTREDLRGENRHGSCGKGIGETAAYALDYPGSAPTVGDCLHPRRLREKLETLAAHYRPLLAGSRHGYPAIDDLIEMYADFGTVVRVVGPDYLTGLARDGRLVFEGAQGVLLDEWRGLHPHTTWSTVEPSNAKQMLAEIGCDPYVLGVTRSYMTRHGAGPFPTEDAGLAEVIVEHHNSSDGFQGVFRIGHFDPILLRYAIAACRGVDGLAVTHLDTLAATPSLSTTRAYLTDTGVIDALELGAWQDLEHQQQLTDQLYGATAQLAAMPVDRTQAVESIAAALDVPVVLVSDGPDRAARSLRRMSPA